MWTYLSYRTRTEKAKLNFWHWCLHLLGTYLINCILKDQIWCILAWANDWKRNKGSSWQTCAELVVHWSAACSCICPLCGFFNLSCLLGDEEFTKEVTELFSELHISSKPDKLVMVSYSLFSKSWRAFAQELLLSPALLVKISKAWKQAVF